MTEFPGIKACIFDAYGTLFDVSSAAARCAADLGDDWQQLSAIWRDKQLQYSWLRSLMGEYVPFWQITQDALDFALATLKIDDADLRQRLLDIYFEIDAYPEVSDMLAALRAGGLKTGTLSNGSPDMLNAAIENAAIDLDVVLSVDDLHVFKPDGRVYQKACDALGVSTNEICFMSSNAWDVWGASNFGFQVVWVNRFGQAAERLPGPGPKAEITDLAALPPLLGLE